MNSCENMIMCVNGHVSLSGEKCNPVTACRGFRSLFVYKMYL
jgi:hypothetical protein